MEGRELNNDCSSNNNIVTSLKVSLQSSVLYLVNKMIVHIVFYATPIYGCKMNGDGVIFNE